MQVKDLHSDNVIDFSAYSASLPPQNVEVEEAILGGILLDPGAIARIVDTLIPDAFYLIAHKQIYKAALALHTVGRPTDLMCVMTWLYDNDLLEKVGGQSKLVQLVDRTVSAINIDRYAELVMNKYHRRQLIKVGNEIVQLGHETTLDLPSVANLAQEKVMEATTYQQGDKWAAEGISSLLVEVFDQIEQGVSTGIKTGLLDLDALTGGLYRKEMITIAGRPGMGKTFMGCYLANSFAMQGLPAVVFSAEMDKASLTKRFLSMHSGVNLAKLMQNKVEPHEWTLLSQALGTLAQIPLFIDDTPASKLTPQKMRAELRRVQVETGLPVGVVVLDYLQKLGDRAAFNRAQVVGKYAGEAKDIAKEFDCPFVCLAQINRETEGQGDKRPGIAQLKDSGDIEQDSDMIFLLYRDEYYNPKTTDRNILEVNVAKQRNGPTGKRKVIFKPETGFYGSLPQTEAFVH
jgi:replicative DNA helicase